MKATSSPPIDPVVSAYAAMVDDDIYSLDLQFFKKYTCKTRDLCISELQDVRSVAVAMTSDLAKTTPPPVFTAQAVALKAAAQDFIAQIDATVAMMRQPGSDYLAVSSTPKIQAVDLAAGAIVCWPKQATLVNQAGYSASGFVCA